MLETIILLIICIINSIACFILGSYITAKSFSNEKPFEAKKVGRVISKTIFQKKQVEADRNKHKTPGNVSMEDWGNK